MQSLLPYHGEVWLVPAAFPATDGFRLLAELLAGIPWSHEEATVMGRRVLIPRLPAWHGETGYVYSGIRLHPAPWTPPLLELTRGPTGRAVLGIWCSQWCCVAPAMTRQEPWGRSRSIRARVRRWRSWKRRTAPRDRLAMTGLRPSPGSLSACQD